MDNPVETEMLEKIEDILNENKDTLDSYKKELDKAPGYMNVLDIMARSHLENEHSRVLEFLLNPAAKHKHPEFGSHFLESLKGKIDIPDTKIVEVARECQIDKGRRIDLLIRTDESVIILENKVNAAPDLDKQLDDYISWAEKTYTKENIVVLYLSKYGSPPDTKSLSEEKRKKLEDEKRFACISFKDILDWLELIVEEEIVKKGKIEIETMLYSALMQYIDSIKGIINTREEYSVAEIKLNINLANKYGEKTRDELTEMIKNLDTIKRGLSLSVFINFLTSLQKCIEAECFVEGKNIKEEIFFTIDYDYPKEDDKRSEKAWRDTILNDTEKSHCIGIMIKLRDDVSFYVGFEDYSSDSLCYIGIKIEGENDRKGMKEKFKKLFNEFKDDRKVIEDSEKFDYLITQPDWIYPALFKNKVETFFVGATVVEHYAKKYINGLMQ
jgi:hypothetical protein